jgi:hypothetical protein
MVWVGKQSPGIWIGGDDRRLQLRESFGACNACESTLVTTVRLVSLINVWLPFSIEYTKCITLSWPLFLKNLI